MNENVIKGACHCGNISYELEWPADGFPITKRECSCSFCRKHGAAYTSHPNSRLNVQARNKKEVTYYRFGHQTADFVFCTRCGGLMFALSKIESKCYAVINVNHFENLDLEEMIYSQTDFDGESVESRFERRANNWTPTVNFLELGESQV